jgi:hypothetical protein
MLLGPMGMRASAGAAFHDLQNFFTNIWIFMYMAKSQVVRRLAQGSKNKRFNSRISQVPHVVPSCSDIYLQVLHQPYSCQERPLTKSYAISLPV